MRNWPGNCTTISMAPTPLNNTPLTPHHPREQAPPPARRSGPKAHNPLSPRHSPRGAITNAKRMTGTFTGTAWLRNQRAFSPRSPRRPMPRTSLRDPHSPTVSLNRSPRQAHPHPPNRQTTPTPTPPGPGHPPTGTSFPLSRTPPTPLTTTALQALPSTPPSPHPHLRARIALFLPNSSALPSLPHLRPIRTPPRGSQVTNMWPSPAGYRLDALTPVHHAQRTPTSPSKRNPHPRLDSQAPLHHRGRTPHPLPTDKRDPGAPLPHRKGRSAPRPRTNSMPQPHHSATTTNTNTTPTLTLPPTFAHTPHTLGNSSMMSFRPR